MPFVLPFIAAAALFTGEVVAGAGIALFGAGAASAALAAGAIVEAAVPTLIEFGALAGASALLSPKPKVNTSGSPQSFKADPRAPVACVMARYGVGGSLVYETTSGGGSKAEHGAAGNEYLTQFVVLGALGPYPALEATRLDDTILTFGGQTCTGGYIRPEYLQNYNPGYSQNGDGSFANNVYKDHVWQAVQLGDQNAAGMPYPTKIAGKGDNLPEWTAAHGFAGFAAVSITRSYDVTTWAGGVGTPQWTLSAGYPVWDPRKDSSWPGGSGPQRRVDSEAGSAGALAARATWTSSDNPIIHALNYAMGFYLPDPLGTGADPYVRLYAGVGAHPRNIDVDAFIRAANVADANGWKITGQWTTADGKRSVLTAMLQAGGAQLAPDCGRISCTVSTPLTALNAGAPITWADLAGAPSLDTTTSIRDRANTAFVSYTSEAHRWQVVQADTPVQAATYVAEDGGRVRSKALTFEYVPGVDQASQLAAYAIVDGRELGNIVLPGKPHLRGYGVGDCLLVDLPELGLHLTKLVVTKRRTDPATGMVTLTCRTETDAKHGYALGRTGVAPPTPGISGFDPSIVAAPIPGSWTATPTQISDPVSGEITHVIRINGQAIDNVYAAQVVVLYAQVTTVDGADVEGPVASTTFAASQSVDDLYLAAGRWHIWLRYITISGAENVENTLDLGIITVAGSTSASTASISVDTIIAERDLRISDLLKQVDDVEKALDSVSADGLADALSVLDAASKFSANLILNPDFSVTDASGSILDWSIAGAWRQVKDAKLGGGTALGNSGDTTGANGLGQIVWGTVVGDILPGNIYSTQARARGIVNDGGLLLVFVDWQSDTSSLNAISKLEIVLRDTPDIFKLEAVTAPPGATKVRIGIALYNVTSNSGCSVSRVKIELGSICTPYSNEGSQAYQAIASQFITGTDYAKSTDFKALYAVVAGPGGLTSQVLQVNQATADALAGKASAQSVTDVQAFLNGSGLTSRITNVLTGRIDVPGGVASVSSVQALSAAATSGPNLVPDGSFSLSVAGSPGGWTFSGSASPQQSSVGNRLIATAGSFQAYSPLFACDGGVQYTLSARLTRYDDGSSLGLRLQFFNGANAFSSSAQVTTPIDSGTPGALRQVTFTAPSGTNRAQVAVFGSVSNGQNVQVQQVKCEPGPVATPYQDGATAVSIAAAAKITSNAVANLSGYAAANYAIQLDANGVHTGFVLLAANGQTQKPISAAGFYADLFFVQGRSGARLAFTDNNDGTGTLSMDTLIVKNANIGYAQVGASNLAGGAVTRTYSVINNSYNVIPPANNSGSTTAPSSPPTTGGGSGGAGSGGTGGKRGVLP